MLLFHSESIFLRYLFLVGTIYKTVEKPKTKLEKKYQDSAFSPKLFFSEERQVLQGPSAAFKLTAIMAHSESFVK